MLWAKAGNAAFQKWIVTKYPNSGAKAEMTDNPLP